MKPQNAVALKLKGNMLLARDRPEVCIAVCPADIVYPPSLLVLVALRMQEAVVVFLQSNAIVKDVQCYEGFIRS